jgi:molybdopterin-guanine dinucleotide biosynthesis protein A
VYPAALAQAVEALLLTGRRAVAALLDAPAATVRRVDMRDARDLLANVNTPEEYARLVADAARSGGGTTSSPA